MLPAIDSSLAVFFDYSPEIYISMEQTYDPFEQEHNRWYHNEWLVTILLFAFWPVGLYALFKGKMYKGVLSKFFGLIAIIVVVLLIKSPSSTSSFSSSTVKNSQWDGSVDVAERYLKRNLLKDPGSYESVYWSQVAKNPDGTYQVTHQFRARNGFGGMGMETITFIISSDGERVIRYF